MIATTPLVTAHPQFSARESTYIRWYPKTLSPRQFLHCEEIKEEFHQGNKANGVYIHVPFCDILCPFCPFNKVPTEDDKVADFVDLLITEIGLYGTMGVACALDFIYFGGGTPSTLNSQQLGRILEALSRSFAINVGCEITMECHPTHLSQTYARDIRSIGVNRISSGIQSLNDKILRTLRSNHSAHDARKAIENVGLVFGDIAIDLLFRVDGQSCANWEADINECLALGGVSHVSCYSLVGPPGSAQPSAEIDVEMSVIAYDRLTGAGMSHYASCASGGMDFASPSKQCAYELFHWRAPQASFIGLGPGALGFVGNRTTINALSLKGYANVLRQKKLPLVSATAADKSELMRRYFVLGVKTLEVEFQPFFEIFGVDAREVFNVELSSLAYSGFIEVDQYKLSVTKIGVFYVDSISDVFFSKIERKVVHPEEPEIIRAEIASMSLSASLSHGTRAI
ncbi:coproporphyrinogen-III oxidase family protein [Rhizobium alvei]|uniref:Coproporphyrinogen-III oxidase family protein n=1 Tax=Rhizobium alvei TaxID=1132659 RepID=A0ABT8YTK9_9HYPH|nr:coproporphyrinogen-III oxidase family protein [Rhizobium alvei]MDO6967111.1 coproporphyrinogen-III oxidase family protein [Rhizobium alvei]